MTLYNRCKGVYGQVPFNTYSHVTVGPFTVQQMDHFFGQIAFSYDFTPSIRLAIMDYSSGAPGVFGSLICFTINHRMWNCEFKEWHSWFKFQMFRQYLKLYNITYERIRTELHHLSTDDWKALNYMLIHGNASIFSSPSQTLDFGTLLQMGLFVQAMTGELSFASEMMRRICMEAQPVRDMERALLDDTPLELLSASIRCMRPNIIGDALVANQKSHREAIFQFELYSAMRGIMQRNDCTQQILAETRGHGENQRFDILISGGGGSISCGFELKSNKRTIAEIETAVKQADSHKQLLGIDKMFVVNFVPRIQVMDDVYHIDYFPDIKVVHVCYAETYDEYELKFLGEKGETQSRKVRSVAS